MPTPETPQNAKSSSRYLDQPPVESSNGPEAADPAVEAPQEEVKTKKELTAPQKIGIIVIIAFLPLIVFWALRPFERIINFLLPPVPSNNQHHSNHSIEPVFTHPFFQQKSNFPFRQCGPDVALCCNGLENVCDLKVNQVMFATLHNAMATKEDGYLLNPNHYLPLELALEAGFRGIHLEVCKCNGRYEFCHGVCHLGARDPMEVWLNLDRFLQDNPQEVLLLSLQLNNDAHQPVDLLEFYEVMRNATRFTRYLYPHENSENDWPTLRRLIGNDKRVLLFYSHGPSCASLTNMTCPRGIHYRPDYWLETDQDIGLEEIQDSCDLRNATTENGTRKSFYSMNHFVSIPDHGVSEILNDFDFISRRMASCAKKYPSAIFNTIAIDFWTSGSIVEFVQRHNIARIPSH